MRDLATAPEEAGPLTLFETCATANEQTRYLHDTIETRTFLAKWTLVAVCDHDEPACTCLFRQLEGEWACDVDIACKCPSRRPSYSLTGDTRFFGYDAQALAAPRLLPGLSWGRSMDASAPALYTYRRALSIHVDMAAWDR